MCNSQEMNIWRHSNGGLFVYICVIVMKFYKGQLSTQIQPYSPSNSASNDAQLDPILSTLIP